MSHVSDVYHRMYVYANHLMCVQARQHIHTYIQTQRQTHTHTHIHTHTYIHTHTQKVFISDDADKDHETRFGQVQQKQRRSKVGVK